LILDQFGREVEPPKNPCGFIVVSPPKAAKMVVGMCDCTQQEMPHCLKCGGLGKILETA
jgi:hypothetical protein